ncbi:hypothetical protein HZB89_02485, partial [archaeon]|nr:hypothetical protein [archaeon]
FMPSFSSSFLSIDSNSPKFVDLALHASPDLKEGSYSLPILVQTDTGSLSRKNLSVKMVDC